ncbi:hypothetical protein CP977_00710 [Streptomyces cinereoruber]|uniref:Uncharacterized protein n=1 Tax=Streptomyces cinereoruber TaxID=67260 RepID=A0ABX6B6H5_9ACTN|nr:hypothetical protein CP977_00710 [Streptomyces cinereoruber]
MPLETVEETFRLTVSRFTREDETVRVFPLAGPSSRSAAQVLVVQEASAGGLLGHAQRLGDLEHRLLLLASQGPGA